MPNNRFEHNHDRAVLVALTEKKTHVFTKLTRSACTLIHNLVEKKPLPLFCPLDKMTTTL